MAALECRCGNRLSDTSVPNDIVFHQFSDTEMENMLRQDYISTMDLHTSSAKIWKCPICYRLYIFDVNGKVLEVYTKESV